MQGNNTKISIVIPYYKGSDFITACIQSLDHSSVDCHIYIVDNDPAGLDSLQSRHSLCIVKTESGIGYGRASNAGVHQAIEDGAKIIVVSNQDVKFLPDTLQKLCSGITDESKLIVNTPLLLDYDLKGISPFFKSQVLVSTGYLNDLEKSTVQEYYNAEGAYGACFAFPARLYSEVGLFDPIFQMYGEDEDLFNRVQRVGGEVRLVPGARLGHFHNHVNASGKAKTQIQFWAHKAHRVLDIRYKKITLSGQFIQTFKDSVKYMIRGNFKYGLLLPIYHAKYLFTSKSIRNMSASDIRKRIDVQVAADLITGKN